MNPTDLAGNAEKEEGEENFLCYRYQKEGKMFRHVCRRLIIQWQTFTFQRVKKGAGIAQLVVLGLAVHSVAGSILLWGHFR